MLRRFREFGPVLLVPLAWLFALFGLLGTLSTHAVFVGHVVMAILLGLFSVTGRTEMKTGTLRVWWLIITVGFVITTAGAIGLYTESQLLQILSLYGWMLLPTVGYLFTGTAVSEGKWIYFGGAALSVVGLCLYSLNVVFTTVGSTATIGGVGAVLIGQTAGIVDAVYRY